MLDPRESDWAYVRISDGPLNVVASADELAPIARQLAEKLNYEPASVDELAASLDRFMQKVYQKPSPTAVAFIYRTEQGFRPILDVYVYWSSPLDLLNDAQEMCAIAKDHSEDLECLDQTFDLFIKIVSPRSYRSLEEFRDQLPGHTLACVSFQR